MALDLPRGVDESGEDNFGKVIEIVRRDIEGWVLKIFMSSVYRQLGDFSLGRRPVWGSASWGKCHLGEVPVGG